MTNQTLDTSRKIFLNSRERRRVLIDLTMLLLLTLNFALWLFDAMFGTEVVGNLLIKYARGFYYWYDDHIHNNMPLIDAGFVFIYLLEFGLSWLSAIRHKTYYRWFFYPFVHFYDLLGSLPFSGTRWLRSLRVIAILYRWHKAGIIDLHDYELPRVAMKYYDIVLEELTDRVVVNVLEGVKDEVRHGGKLGSEVMEKLIEPRRAEIAQWAVTQVGATLQQAYVRHQDDMRDYTNGLIARAVERNKELRELDIIPVLGPYFSAKIERAVQDIVANTLEEAVNDLTSPQAAKLMDVVIAEILKSLLQSGQDSTLQQATIEMTEQFIDMLIKQVKVQQWKLVEDRDRVREQDHPTAH